MGVEVVPVCREAMPTPAAVAGPVIGPGSVGGLVGGTGGALAAAPVTGDASVAGAGPALAGQPSVIASSGRLLQARAALASAEERAGLRSVQERGVAAAAVRGAGAAPSRLPQLSVGVTQVVGSTAVVLALAAHAQGAGWCAVLGGEDLGWGAAAELGLDLGRVVCVPVREHGPAQLLPVLGALLDGVDLLLVTAAAASRLRAQGRRRLLARVREREAWLLTDGPWEGARLLVAQPGRAPEQAVVVPLPGLPGAPGGAVPAPARELEEGRLAGMSWVLAEPARRVGVRLEVTEAGPVWEQLEGAALPDLGGASRWQERGAV